MRATGKSEKNAASAQRRIVEVMRSLSRACGLCVCIHDLTDFTRAGGAKLLDQMHRNHQHPFCIAAKARTRGLACVRDDMRKANGRAARVRRPFVKRCHAGVIELVTPIIIEGSHAGSLFLGPTAESSARAPRCASRLPIRSRKELGELAPLATAVAAHIADLGVTMHLMSIGQDRHSEPVRQGIEFAGRKYAEPVTVEDAAQHAHLSPSRFAHVFSEETGMPFHAYLTGIRIERAKKLLSRSALRIGEIATMTGFCNQNYFASVFREHARATPTEYRKKAHAEPIDV